MPSIAPDPPKHPVADMYRYAGWLAKDHVSASVRRGVQALMAAIDAGTETATLLLTLDTDIRRLPGGDIRNMLRKSLVAARAAITPSAKSPGPARAGDRDRS